jgi:Na+/H+ antiporter NhaD/arsenite permease-like protein
MLLLVTFVLGYFAIAFEHPLKLNKAASALITGVCCWVIYVLQENTLDAHGAELLHHLSEISSVLFFLLGAMVIVELIDAHDGFEVLSSFIKTNDKRKFLVIICLFSFFLSAILDNLTTTIVMITLLRKSMQEGEDRKLFSGMIIIAANAGGVWSPIGDVTTTMLWMGGQISALNIVLKLFIPATLTVAVPMALVFYWSKGVFIRPKEKEESIKTGRLERNLILLTGICGLLFVPVFKSLTGLPPFMGMLLSLGGIWAITEWIHKHKEEEVKSKLTPASALRRIDTPSILFFLGILLAVAALNSSGNMLKIASWMTNAIPNQHALLLSFGALSAIVDNVPLVAAAQSMFDLSTHASDSYFWEMLAYTAGTGGSILIIGSAAGVAAMGIENISFFWYLKKVSWLALIGFITGAGAFMLMSSFL